MPRKNITRKGIQNHKPKIIKVEKMKKVYLTLGGGLGDVFWTYIEGHNGWQFLKSFKNKYPDGKIKVLAATHNPQVEELLKYHPDITVFKNFGWVLDGTELWKKYKGGFKHLKDTKDGLSKNRNRIYLSTEDQEKIDEITHAGPFLLIHPFAGEKIRCAIFPDDYKIIIDKLLEETNFNIVVIGGSYIRTNKVNRFKMTEEFEYSHDRVFNLVNKSNCRVCATLAEHQHSFIGSWSAYSCVSWIYNKPSTIIVPKTMAKVFKEEKQGPEGRWKDKKNINIISVEGTILNSGREYSLDQIIVQILKEYK
jgi:ADP-heptose:LPS heptosyltransferase